VVTLAAFVRACVYPSICLTVSSISANLPVRFNLVAEPEKLDETMDAPVLLKIEDCICAYLLLLI